MNSSAAVVTVRTADEGSGSEDAGAAAGADEAGTGGGGAGGGAGGGGGWHPQLAHLPQLPHPLRRKQVGVQCRWNYNNIY